MKELGLLVFLITISGLIFASFTYFIEIGTSSGLTSIPTGIYWVVVTMTTVGYGDIAPTTGLGKLFGSMCAVAGVLVLSLPIPIIAANFEKFHKNHQVWLPIITLASPKLVLGEREGQEEESFAPDEQEEERDRAGDLPGQDGARPLQDLQVGLSPHPEGVGAGHGCQSQAILSNAKVEGNDYQDTM